VTRRVVGCMPMMVVIGLHALVFCLCMTFSENRSPLFGVMHVGTPLVRCSQWHSSMEPVAPTRRKWQSD